MPLFRRRPLLRAAAVSGGAYMYGKHRADVEAQQQEQAYYQGQRDALAEAQAPAPAATGSAGITAEDTARLAELGNLHEMGILTDAEFAQEKSRVLGAR